MRALALFCLFVIGAVNAWGDRWAPPVPRQYLSANGQYRFSVVPRGVKSPLQYFEDKVDGKPKPGQPADDPDGVARGTLERRTADGMWTKEWTRQLVNEVGPVEALVSESGNYVVTSDNWHSIGFGPNVVVIYGPKGRLIRSLTLRNLVSDRYIRALPRSVSSVQWGQVSRFDEEKEQVVVDVLVPSADPESAPKFLEFRIDLATGRIVRPPERAMAEALVTADAVNREAARVAAERKAWFRNPLRAPSPDAGSAAWHDYLWEAVARLSDKQGETAWREVLSGPGDPDFVNDRERLCSDLIDSARKAWPDNFAIASPKSNGTLASELRTCAAAVPPCGLSKADIYIFAPKEFLSDAAAALAATCARTKTVDTEIAIPQRRERIPK